ncbi:TIGR04282 family arsenosugar biosynthesis glycosyltransferase [Neptuniibacter halophilus]|uniref:TIGR04282 family arsenosugar biosynthesis glycosyltransferase n=1 Tax=Neptuniibacter halophilus TaxID=651666 RepID=UPI0025745170|nr:DUF2064 domain-containing protein [Neptuniibacter halophilus]
MPEKQVSATLLLVCKKPLLNQGKQRLAATLGAESAVLLARALLNCALEDLADWPGPVVISPSTAKDTAWAQALLPQRPDLLVQPQPSGNLGERINQVDQVLRKQGHQRIIIIGSDAPMLTAEHYAEAAQALTEYPVVFSAADDGGVILMGARQPWPELGPLPWSTERLGQALCQTCADHGLKAGFIRPGYDIDLQDDLLKLAVDLASDPRPARQALLKQIAQVLPKSFL